MGRKSVFRDVTTYKGGKNKRKTGSQPVKLGGSTSHFARAEQPKRKSKKVNVHGTVKKQPGGKHK